MSRNDTIRSLRDINKENLELILRSHYCRRDITISEDNSDLKEFEGNNDFYNSQIRKFSLKVCTSVTKINIPDDIKLKSFNRSKLEMWKTHCTWS